MPGQTSLTMRAKDEHDAEVWRRRFEKASVEAVKSWRYDTSKLIDGKRVAKRRGTLLFRDSTMAVAHRTHLSAVPACSSCALC